MKSFTLKISAEIMDNETGAAVVHQNLEFNGRAPAIHNAIQNMGNSFVHGLGTSLSKQMIEGQEEKK